MSCLCRASQVLWGLGCPDQALARSREALILAQSLAHPHSLAYALTFAALLHQLRREPQMAQQQAEAALKVATEHGFPIWKSIGGILRGWGIALQGRAQEGIALIQQGTAMWGAVGAEVSLPYYLFLLAEAQGRDGDPQKGLDVLNEALSAVPRTKERWWEAELYRLCGELTLQKLSVVSSQLSVPNPQHSTPSTQAEAEECFLEAIDISRKQHAKSLELRAVMSLVRLRQHQTQDHASRITQHDTRTRLDEAHTMLSEIYHWFTEGFDTKDLQDAKALIEELNH